MKKLYLFIGIIIVFIFMILTIYFVPTPNIIIGNEAIVKQIYAGNNIQREMSKEDAEKCIELFKGKWCYIDNPSCGFDEDTVINIGFNKFQLACDGDAIIKNGNKYFTLSDEEYQILRDIINNYGVIMPCV